LESFVDITLLHLLMVLFCDNFYKRIFLHTLLMINFPLNFMKFYIILKGDEYER